MRGYHLPRPFTLAALLALAAAAAPLAAQRAPASQRGWLGFSYMATSRRLQTEPPAPRMDREEVLVGEVLKSSPADRAGMEPGDTVVAVNGEPASRERIAAAAARLHPGDTVRIEVRRAGRTQTLTLRAAERPAYLQEFGMMPGPIVIDRDFGMTGDSIYRTMRVYLDSARTQLDSLHLPRVRFERRDSLMIVHGLGGNTDTIHVAPFQRGMVRLRLGADSVFPRVEEKVFELQRDGLPGFDVELTGRRAIAGASLQELNSQLADYFGVREGLLVERVGAGTPAARAGLQAGDVVTAADARPVGDIADLRRALRGRAGTVKLDIVRKGKKETVSVKWP